MSQQLYKNILRYVVSDNLSGFASDSVFVMLDKIMGALWHLEDQQHASSPFPSSDFDKWRLDCVDAFSYYHTPK